MNNDYLEYMDALLRAWQAGDSGGSSFEDFLEMETERLKTIRFNNELHQRVVNELVTERAVTEFKDELAAADRQPVSVRLRRVQEDAR